MTHHGFHVFSKTFNTNKMEGIGLEDKSVKMGMNQLSVFFASFSHFMSVPMPLINGLFPFRVRLPTQKLSIEKNNS